jgi:transposase-like protein
MMAERRLSVDHATVHRRVIRYAPERLERFNSRRQAVTGTWPVDATSITVRGR